VPDRVEDLPTWEQLLSDLPRAPVLVAVEHEQAFASTDENGESHGASLTATKECHWRN
jgi:hypothetical protein